MRRPLPPAGHVGAVRLRITGDGLTNVPVPVGSRAELRLLHVFHMRDGRIAREEVFEGWRQLEG